MMIDERILFSSGVLLKNQIWYVSVEGYLMYMDIATGKASYAWISNMDSWIEHPVCDQMFAYEESIYWVDQFGNSMHEYNISQEEFYLYELPATKRIDSCYAGIFQSEEKLFLFPKKTKRLIVFNMKQKQVEIHEKLAENEENDNMSLLYYAVRNNNYVYAFSSDKKSVLQFNLENCQYKYLSFPQDIMDISYAVFEKNTMYILTYQGTIYAWNIEDGKLFEIYVCSETNMSFGRMAVTEHRIFLLPALSEKILVIERKSGYVLDVDYYPVDLQYREICWSKYTGFVETAQYIWYANRTANYILYLNKEKEEIGWKKIIPPTSQEEYEFCCRAGHLQQEFYQKSRDNILREQGTKMLYLFLAAKDKKQKNLKKSDNQIGKTIWEVEKSGSE